MQDAPDVQSILDDARRNGYPPGQQRAFVMAKVLEKTQVIVVGAEDPELVASAKMIRRRRRWTRPLPSCAESLGSDLDVLIVPHALLTLPIVRRAEPSEG